MIIDLVLPLLVFMMIYLMGRVTVNGFEERKVTSLKRQTLNNRLEQNEISWNYWAVDTMNKYFTIKDEKVYMATLLPPFYLMMFGNGNYGYLPLSVRQEFAGQNKGLIEKYYEEDGTIVSMYRRIINRGSEVYFTDYYKNNFHGSVDGQVEEIWRNFDSERVFWGCDGLCNIYRLKQK